MNNINLLKEKHQSEFYNDLLKDEFENLLLKEALVNDFIYAKNTFVYEHEEFIELGVYLINTSNKEVFIKNIPVSVFLNEDTIIPRTLEINKKLKPEEALYTELKLEKELIDKCDNINLNDIYVGFSNLTAIKKYPNINIEITNIPRIEDYNTYREVKKFIKSLPPIESGKLVIDVFKCGRIEEGFFIILLLRNSSHKPVNILSIPITVIADDGLPVYAGVFKNKENSFYLESEKGKIMNIVIPNSEFPEYEYYDESKFKIFFK